MKTLVMGASGATGKHLVEQLLSSGQEVKAVVRSPEKLPKSWKENNQLTIVKASISDMTAEEMKTHLADCDAVASCLGHNLTFKGMFGKPRKLVTDAVKLACKSVNQNDTNKSVKFVLMNTTGNRNRDLNEQVSFGHKMVVGLLRL
jgi:putative NADH-flavin reductase